MKPVDFLLARWLEMAIVCFTLPNQKRRKAYKKGVPAKCLHLKEDSSDESSSEESSEESLQVQSQWRLISELLQLFQLLSVINIVQLRKWNGLFCWILNFALSLGISFVPPDCFLVRSGLVSDLTNDLLMKKNYLQPCGWFYYWFLILLEFSGWVYCYI